MNPVQSLARRPSRARSIARPQGPSFSSDNPLLAFLAFLAENTKVGERTARQYVAHLQRLADWLDQRYQDRLLEATTRDLRMYKTELGKRQKPASVNAALAALRRFYGWAAETERIVRNPAQHLTDVAAQPLALKGFSDVDRRRLVREAEKAGLMSDAIVTLLLNTGLRVDELVTLTWERVHLQARSGRIDVVGKGDKHRRLPLNAEARKALEAIQAPTGRPRRRRRVPLQARAVHGARDRVPGDQLATPAWPLPRSEIGVRRVSNSPIPKWSSCQEPRD